MRRENGMALVKNEERQITITGMTHDGSGVAHAEGMAVFVPGCAVGDVALVRIVQVRARLAYGRLVSLVSSSPVREAPDCPAFPRCGGCVFRHVTYEEELRAKTARVRDAFRRIGGLDLEPLPAIGSEQTLGYRNKAQYPAAWQDGAPVFGFYAPRSHRVVPAEHCLLQPPAFAHVLAAVKDWMCAANVSVYDERTGRGFLRHLYLRQAPVTGELMVCLVANGTAKEVPRPALLTARCHAAAPQLKSLVLNVNTVRTNVILGDACETVWGAPRIEDVLCGLRFSLSPQSFYQINSAQAERLYARAAAYAALDGTGLLVDLYCGAGTIGLCLAKGAGEVLGVELVPQAVEDAARNAETNGITNARFLCADAGEAAARLLREGKKPRAVVLDPPRKGLDEQTVDAVARMSPERVVYVSCDPETLARDLARFAARGYAAREAQPFDLFPRTGHVETVVLMSRVKE